MTCDPTHTLLSLAARKTEKMLVLHVVGQFVACVFKTRGISWERRKDEN